MKSLKKENERLKKIVADLQLDKVILKERRSFNMKCSTDVVGTQRPVPQCRSA